MIENSYLIKLAFKNVMRNKRRTFLTMLVIAISVGAIFVLLGYIKGAFGSMINDYYKITGHINIQHNEYKLKERMLSLTVTIEDYEQLKSQIDDNDHVVASGGRIKFGGLIDFNNANEPGLGMGIDPEAEKQMLELQNFIIRGRYFSGAPNEAIVGSELSLKLNIEPGDTITVITRTAYGSMSAANFVTVGVAEMLAGMFNSFFFVDLNEAQYLLDMEDQVTEYIVITDDPENLETITGYLQQISLLDDRYIILPWYNQPIWKSYLPLINYTYAITIGLFGLIASFSIINTMLMAVFERTREIGVFTAFGMRKNKVLKMFLTEAAVIGFIGGIFGLIWGGAALFYMVNYGISLGKAVQEFSLPIRNTLYASFEWYHAVLSLLIGIIITVIAAYMPALKAARTEPTKALRTH
ncbi:ABC transporter permease [candidate division KSB1 bacterium]